MKRFVSYLAVLFVLTATQSCKKPNGSKTNSQVINIPIKIDEGYEYDLGSFGDEDGAIINRQAMHYDVSTIERDINVGKEVYKYKPASNYTGTDEVELNFQRGSDGASQNNKILVTTIKFTITN